MMKRVLISVLCLLSLSTMLSAKNIIGMVTKIVDGNTIIVTAHGKTEYTVRLFGIYAPVPEQEFGPRAGKETAALCLGKIVKVEVVGKDFDGELFANVHTEDGTFVNEQLVARGFAWHYKKQAKNKRLALLEETARDGKLGLWSGKDPVAPWEFKK